MAHRRDKIWKPSLSNPVIESIADKIVDKVPDDVTHVSFDGNESATVRRAIKIRTQSISIGIPMDELMFSMFFQNFMYLSIMPWDNFITTASTFVCEARNKIHNAFLEETKTTHLFMIDSDVLPPPDTIERLLSHDKMVIGGWYRKKEKFPIKLKDGTPTTIQRPVVYDYSRYDEDTDSYMFVPRFNPGKGLEKVDGMGAGCWMIRRDAAEMLGKNPFTMKFGGEDLSFCRKLTELGVDIWVDWSINAAHIGAQFV
jgi:hypothetical protein